MKKTVLILIFVLSAIFYSEGQQVDPNQIKNSLVRVKVKTNGGKDKVMTGFVWKNPDQVVTSLHGMSKNGSIEVLYMNQAWRKVKIKKVYQRADLVLLEVLPNQAQLPDGVIPIKNFNVAPIKMGTEVYAFGFNGGAKGASSRNLKKGSLSPAETLENLVPDKDLNALKIIGFPALNLDIFYLEGSLLPGFSGAPVFDAQGRLIGVGDGGLEKGASNVSWIIPAKYLTDLENSTVTALPSDFEALSPLFSADVIIETSEENTENGEKEFLEQNYEDPLMADDFEFYFTKNRSLYEMMETSDDTENLVKFAEELEGIFKVSLDYEGMNFNIFEDINNGVILAVPEDQNLVYSEEDEVFEVISEDDDGISIIHFGIKDDFSETDFADVLTTLRDLINTDLAESFEISGFTIDNEYSYSSDFGSDRKVAWILSTSNESYTDEDGLTYEIYVYMTVLMGSDKTFISMASIPVPTEFIELAGEIEQINCNDPGEYSQYCEFMAKVFKTFSATHLTTFAY